MYIEGKCNLKSFVPDIVRHITDAVDSRGGKMWEMVSSKVGVVNTTNSDNGWVFKSQGSSGKDNLIISFSNGQRHTAVGNWVWGNEVGVATDYTPGAPGENGTFTGKLIDGMPIVQTSWSDYSADNTPVRYFMSITADRVIIAYLADIVHSYSRSNLIYLGKPVVTGAENDPGCVLATALSYDYNAPGIIRMTNPDLANTGTMDIYNARAEIGDQARGWGGRLFPSQIVLHKSVLGRGGQRGLLDLFVVKQDGQFRKIDNVTIGSTEYFAFELPSSNVVGSTGYNNNFCPANSLNTHMYLFPKI